MVMALKGPDNHSGSMSINLSPTPGGMPRCSNKGKAPVPKPIKANLKPKPKMEVPGNKTLPGANPILFTFDD